MAEVVLRFIAGRQQGREFPLENGQAIVIGRADEADLTIDEDTVSRKHATLSRKNDEIVLEDCSKNGTYLNGRPVLNAVLKPGDQIHVGRTILKVVVNGPLMPNWMLTKVAPVRSPAGNALATAVQPLTAAVGTATTEHFRGSIADIALTD